jgi:type II secretion system protein C
MKQKISTIFLLICLFGASLYSLQSMHDEPAKKQASQHMHKNFDQYASEQSARRSFVESSLSEPVNEEYLARSSAEKARNDPALPVFIKVIGIDASTRCLLEFGGVAAEYEVGDMVFSMPIQVISIARTSVRLSYNGTVHVLPLQLPNLLAKSSNDSQIDPYKMSPEQIGTRPQILEHIVKLTESDFIAQGMIASIGMNPALFQQAGLQDDDVIQLINGYSVGKPAQMQELQSSVRYSDTIVFEVIRKGRRITLYLDIPSEALTISQ